MICHTQFSLLQGRHYSDHKSVMSACEEMVKIHIRSPFLLALMVDAYEEDGSEERRQDAIKVRYEVALL